MCIKPNVNSSLLTLLLNITLLVFFTGCKEATKPATGSAVLFIELESEFQKDSVQVKLDGNERYSETVTTDFSISLASSRQISVSPGSHHIEIVVINHGSKGDTIVDVKDTVTVSVAYQRDVRKIIFGFYNSRPRPRR